ncbi:MAG: saccharopine dehydrogenase NADP-binding domain-containing protein, partial [Longimicrobiales bacterium]|nr:saccharopine dehydrogenase NADP-binding domain-containing protein [Longimicrobiales bacterium]
MSDSQKWLLYGAYGYTGRLIAEEAVKRGLRPVVAGRNGEKTRRMAERLELEHRVFSLDEPSALRRALEDVDLVLHAAGPYSRTFRPMAGACLESGCHYLDITGEIPVLEAARAMNDRARDAGILMVPAVGLDVVPTDCAAARAAEALPGATRLDLALHSGGGPSRGTARTMVERMGEPGKLRDAGRIV